VCKDSIEQILAKLKIIAIQILTINPTVKLLISGLLARPTDIEVSGPKLTILNRQLKKDCSSWGISFVASQKMILKYGKPLEHLYYDGLHLSKAGVVKLQQFLCQRLSEYGVKPSSHSSLTVYLRRFQWQSDFSYFYKKNLES
jgi:hypothetical protein